MQIERLYSLQRGRTVRTPMLPDEAVSANQDKRIVYVIADDGTASQVRLVASPSDTEVSFPVTITADEPTSTTTDPTTSTSDPTTSTSRRSARWRTRC